MVVYVVCDFVQYEGHGAPLAVFDNLDAAIEYAQANKEKYDDIEIYRREIGAMMAWKDTFRSVWSSE